VNVRTAYAPRRPLRARVRGRIQNELVRLKEDDGGPDDVDHLRFLPPVKSDEELASLSARVNWYLRGNTLPIYVDGARGRDVRPDAAPYMDASLVRDPGWERHRPRGRARVVLHRLTPRALLPYLRSEHATLADPNLFYLSERYWFALGRTYAQAGGPGPAESVRRLLERAPDARTAFVLATGPSAGDVDPSDVDADVRITCNSAVRDQQLLDWLRPDVIAFGDPVFHYGPSRYAAAFRRDLLRAAEQTDALLVTTDGWVNPLLNHHPDLMDRLAVLALSKEVPWRAPTLEQPAVRNTGNVLTNLMLPCALALADEITIAGCDGRKPEERYYWRHNRRTQYSDELMRSAFEAHPAFFRDVSYEDYYDRHIEELEEFLSTTEAAGKRFSCLTASHIPALLRRGAPRFPDR
jgi:hypothetical protein